MTTSTTVSTLSPLCLASEAEDAAAGGCGFLSTDGCGIFVRDATGGVPGGVSMSDMILAVLVAGQEIDTVVMGLKERGKR